MNYLFTGDEPFLKEKTLSDLKSKVLSKDHENLDFNVYYGGADSVEDIISCASTLPFASKNRIIYLKDTAKLSSSEQDALLNYLEKPFSRTTLILDFIKCDEKGVFLQKLTKLAKKIHFEKPSGAQMDQWIRREAQALNKDISEDAVNLLREGADLKTIKNEIEKGCLFSGARREITRRDIEETFAEGYDEDIFRLVTAISRRDAKLSLDIISKLLLRRTSSAEIIGLMAWYFRKLSREKTAGNIGFSKKELKDKFDLLLATDLAAKRSSLNSSLWLEFCILKLCR